SSSSSGGFLLYCAMTDRTLWGTLRPRIVAPPRAKSRNPARYQLADIQGESMSSFKALRVHLQDKATIARLETIGLDDPRPGQVVIRIGWSGINYKDALAVTGKSRI